MAAIEKFSVGGKEVISHADIEEVMDVQARLDAASEQCLALEVVDDESYEQAGEYLQSVSSVYKLVEGTIEPFRKRSYDFYKGILDQKKQMLDPGDKAIKHLKQQIAAYVKQIEAKQREERERLIEAAKETGDYEVEVETQVPEVATVSTRSKWVAELTDIKALCRAVADGKAPASIVTLNQSEANRVAKSLKGSVRIPGIRVREEKIVVRSGR